MNHAAIEYRRLRAPRGQGETLIDPPLAAAAALLAENRQLLSSVQGEFWGESFAALRVMARSHLLQEARRFTSRYRPISPADLGGEEPIVLAGHQPELFHVGVWFKNMVLSHMGQECGAAAVNLIIDNDTLSAPAIRVPAGTLSEPRVEAVPFDRPSAVIAYEERAIADMDYFASFAARVRATAGGMLPGPMILDRLWPEAVRAARAGATLGEALAAARHGYEAAWGLETWEVPLSAICRGEAFRRFLLQVLSRLEQFQSVYNESLAEYRKVNKVRSRSHPAPDLETADEYREAPFWIWSKKLPHRQRLFVRTVGEDLELTDRQHEAHTIRIPLAGNRKSALGALEEAEASGVKLRPRALITTLFARLFLGDLFLHGIGGAKYDQLTDALMRRFFGMEAPSYMTATATAYLPLKIPRVEPADVSRARREQRELEFHPEKGIDLAEQPAAESLVAAKQRAIGSPTCFATAKQRHQAIVAANKALEPWVADKRCRLVRQIDELERAAWISRQLHVREFAFVLFSEDFLRPLLLDQIIA